MTNNLRCKKIILARNQIDSSIQFFLQRILILITRDIMCMNECFLFTRAHGCVELPVEKKLNENELS